MASSRGPIRRFFGAIGTVLSVIRKLFMALFTIIIVAYIAVAAGFFFKSTSIPEEGALRVEIAGQIVDQLTYTEPLQAVTNPDISKEYVLRDLISAIEFARDDSHINSMILVLHSMENSGVSKIEELGEAIESFKASGKRVIAVSDSFSQQQYLLASYADEILMHPMGAVELLGFSSYQLYMAEAIDKLGINVHVFRTGPHKSAVEPLIANEMSAESREQSQRILDDIWGSIREGIQSRRDLDSQQIIDYSTNLDELMLASNGDLADLALEFNLVDQAIPRDQIIEYLQTIAGKNDAGDFYEYVNLAPYLQHQRLTRLEQSDNRVGLLVAKGAIYDGVQESGSIGGDSTAYLLKQARLNEDYDALVIRVDSPGGSAFASEIIRREIDLFRDQGTPVFISMGSVAASGGYWISSPADEIWATPTTITGSIGAFAALATFEDSLAKLGLYSDGVSTGPLAGVLSVQRPMSDEAKSIIQKRIDNLYGQFLDQVATDRDIALDDLEPIAGGRVWTGKQALELGLVDQLGSLEEVIAAAATKADLGADYDVDLIEPRLSRSQQILKWFTDRVSVDAGSLSWVNHLLAPVSNEVDEVKAQLDLLSDPENMYLHCGVCELIQSY